MKHNSHIILVTKQCHIDSLLDDRMTVWTMTFPAILDLLLAKWGQCPMSRGATEAMPNRIDEIRISQQHLSKLDIKPYTLGRFARLEVIYIFHTSCNVGLYLSEESNVDATVCCLIRHVRCPGNPGIVGCTVEMKNLRLAWDLIPTAFVRAPHL